MEKMNITNNLVILNNSYGNLESLITFLLRISYFLIQPLGVIFGIPGNIWILIVLLTQNVNISQITKIYYIFFAFADLMACVKHLLYNVLCDGLLIITSGKYSLCFDSLSQLTCVMIAWLYHISENAANYAVAALAIERMIAVLFPLKAKFLLGKKFTTFLLFFLILPQCLYFVIVIPFIKKLKNLEPRPTLSTCSQDASTNFLSYSFRILQLVYNLALHVMITLIATMLLIVKLKSIRRQRNLLIENESKIAKINGAKENRATKTLLAIAMINLIIYGSLLSSRVAILASDIVIKFEKQTLYLFNGLFVFFVMITIIPRCSNIFVYLILVPSFRKSAACKR